MDLNRAIRDLYEELRKLNEVIAALEELDRTGTMPSTSQRGRKSMGQEERRIVSERMKRYWADRRNLKRAGARS